MKYIVIYLLIINTLGLLTMYVDKQRAKKKQYRIPEKTLFMCAALGGSIGSMVGMQLFRHKTKHKTFTIGMPAILIAQVAVVLLAISLI